MGLYSSGSSIKTKLEQLDMTWYLDSIPGEKVAVPYGILSIEPGTPTSSGLDGRRDRVRAGFYVVCVSNTSLGCLRIADDVRDHLKGFDPDDTGWSVWEEPLGTRPFEDKEITNDRRWGLTLFFRFYANRSTT